MRPHAAGHPLTLLHGLARLLLRGALRLGLSDVPPALLTVGRPAAAPAASAGPAAVPRDPDPGAAPPRV